MATQIAGEIAKRMFVQRLVDLTADAIQHAAGKNADKLDIVDDAVVRLLVWARESPAQMAILQEGATWAAAGATATVEVFLPRILTRSRFSPEMKKKIEEYLSDTIEALGRDGVQAIREDRVDAFIAGAKSRKARRNAIDGTYTQTAAAGGNGSSVSKATPTPVPKAEGHDHEHGHDHSHAGGDAGGGTAAAGAAAAAAGAAAQPTHAETRAANAAAAKVMDFNIEATRAIASLNKKGSWRFAEMCKALRASHYRDPADEIDGAAILRKGVRAFFNRDPESAKTILESRLHPTVMPIHKDLAVQQFLGAAEMCIDPSIKDEFEAAKDAFFDGQMLKVVGRVAETAFDIVKVIGVAWALLWGTAIVSGIVAAVAAMFDADAGSKFFLILTGVTFGLGLIPAGVFAATAGAAKKPLEKIQEGVDKSADTLTKRFIGGGSDR